MVYRPHVFPVQLRVEVDDFDRGIPDRPTSTADLLKIWTLYCIHFNFKFFFTTASWRVFVIALYAILTLKRVRVFLFFETCSWNYDMYRSQHEPSWKGTILLKQHTVMHQSFLVVGNYSYISDEQSLPRVIFFTASFVLQSIATKAWLLLAWGQVQSISESATFGFLFSRGNLYKTGDSFRRPSLEPIKNIPHRQLLLW